MEHSIMQTEIQEWLPEINAMADEVKHMASSDVNHGDLLAYGMKGLVESFIKDSKCSPGVARLRAFGEMMEKMMR